MMILKCRGEDSEEALVRARENMLLAQTCLTMMNFYCFESNTDKTNRFDSDWLTRQRQYKNKNIIITTSKTGASRLIEITFFDLDTLSGCVSKHTLRKPAPRQRVSCKRSLQFL
jgi:hypothetical protein